TDSDLLARLREILPRSPCSALTGSASLRTLLRLFMENPDFRILIRLMASIAIEGPPMGRRGNFTIPKGAMVTAGDDPPEVRVSSAALRLLHAVGGTIDEVDIELVVGSAGPLVARLIGRIARDR